MPSRSEVAVVTGAGSGIGRAVARELSCEEGLTVLAVGRHLAPLEETAATAAGQVVPVEADVSTVEGRQRIQAAVQALGQIRFLVHGAGVFTIALLGEISLEAWREVAGANVEGRLFLTQALLRNFAPRARVLFVGSRSARRPRHGAGAYCITMAASSMLFRCLQRELAGHDVLVGSAVPGSVDTRILATSLAADPAVFPDALEYRREQAAGQLVPPATVGRFFHWLLTGAADQEFTAHEWELEDRTHHHLWRRSDDG